ncbi:hypothetical protein AAL_03318 [Moelleriella libera RCEF 2490]|uniref:Uncharacterized protein n=1 Tax=Moelleriella libera RCEF 2490 TaxID=1081109 RepID=A0A168D4S7_9HYPO|nr:hypothetical protein AAL_03318 [Moelleriella libera RCEF 2490]
MQVPKGWSTADILGWLIIEPKTHKATVIWKDATSEALSASIQADELRLHAKQLKVEGKGENLPVARCEYCQGTSLQGLTGTLHFNPHRRPTAK